jgi:hypothetical protein
MSILTYIYSQSVLIFQCIRILILGQPYPGAKLAPGTIRLVVIEPGAFNRPIFCTLDTLSLDEGPAYRALSYTWGVTKHKKHIYLNGKSFLINRNLYDALKRLRSEQYRQTYWIDMLCIDQKDANERSEQVELMPDIYTKAKNTIFWLADTENDTIDGRNVSVYLC